MEIDFKSLEKYKEGKNSRQARKLKGKTSLNVKVSQKFQSKNKIT
jgi:hypothetical protein